MKTPSIPSLYFIYNTHTMIHGSNPSQTCALNRMAGGSQTASLSSIESPSAKNPSWKQRSSSTYIRMEITVRSFTMTSNTLLSNIAWIRSVSSTSLSSSSRNANDVCGALSTPWLMPGYVGCSRSTVKVSVIGSHERTV